MGDGVGKRLEFRIGGKEFGGALADALFEEDILGFDLLLRALALGDIIDELRQLLSADRTEAAPASGAPAPKRKISAAGRRRMAAAQQARWAKARGEAEPASSPATPKPAKQKRKLSEAGRKAISEATKKRWALKKAEAQKAQTAVTKKAAVKSPAKAATKAAGKRTQKKAQEAAATPAAQ